MRKQKGKEGERGGGRGREYYSLCCLGHYLILDLFW